MEGEALQVRGALKRIGLILTASIVLMLISAAGAQAFIYWATGDGIRRANNNGSVSIELVSSPGGRGCAVAVDGSSVYWIGGGLSNENEIFKAPLNGPTGASLLGGNLGGCGLAVNSSHLFWANGRPIGGNVAGRIGRSTLTGNDFMPSFLENPANPAFNPCGLAVDGAHIYWADPGGGQTGIGAIGRANLDGSFPEYTFITGQNRPCGVAVDGSHIYWANMSQGQGTIGRANLNGTGVDPNFISGLAFPCGVAVDGSHIYWSTFLGPIGRANLDGTAVNQGLVSAPPGTCGIAVDSGFFRIRYKMNKLKKFKGKGFVKVPVTVPGAGLVRLLRTKQVRGQRLDAKAAGEVTLTVRARGRALDELDRTGKVKVKTKVSFGTPGSVVATRTLTLVKRSKPPGPPT